jgi:DNA invertase Pin-like site-specific DNA recombinase
MKAVIYAAKSTEDKHGSIPTQLEDCRALVQREGWEVLGEHTDEAFSAYHGNRGPGLAQATADCETNAPCALIVQHSDRLARGDGIRAKHLVEYALWAMQHDITIRSVQDDQTFGDLLYAVVTGQRNTEDSKRKSQSTRQGLERRRTAGKPVGGLPYGFCVETTIEGGEVRTARVIDAAAGRIVRQIFEWTAAAVTPGDIARRLNAEGVPTMRGKRWCANSIHGVIDNDVYEGRNGYPALIDTDLADRARAMRTRMDPAAAQRRQGGRRPTEPAMLKGVAFCTCGAPLYSTRKWLTGGERAYVCRERMQATGLCRSRVIPAQMAEQRVLEHLTLFVGDVDEWIGEQLTERQAAAAARERRVDELLAQLAVLDKQREQRMAELREVGITPLGLEVVEGIDRERAFAAMQIDDAKAALAEWDAELDSNAIVAYYAGLVDLVKGRVARAQGVEDVNRALHESLTGIWLSLTNKTLTAQVRLRPTGDDDLDVVAESLFGTLRPEPEWLALQSPNPRSNPRLIVRMAV